MGASQTPDSSEFIRRTYQFNTVLTDKDREELVGKELRRNSLTPYQEQTMATGSMEDLVADQRVGIHLNNQLPSTPVRVSS
jgi:hypothetical protein